MDLKVLTYFFCCPFQRQKFFSQSNLPTEIFPPKKTHSPPMDVKWMFPYIHVFGNDAQVTIKEKNTNTRDKFLDFTISSFKSSMHNKNLTQQLTKDRQKNAAKYHFGELKKFQKSVNSSF